MSSIARSVFVVAATATAVSAASGCTTDTTADVAEARAGDLIISVEVSGTLEAVDSSPVRPPTIENTRNFKISYLAVEGTVVKAGDRLAVFDGTELSRELETLKNEAESAATEVRKQTSASRLARADDALALKEREAALKKLELKVNQEEDLVSMLELKTIRLDRDIADTNLTHMRAKAALARRRDQAVLAGFRDRLAYTKSRITTIQASLAKLMVAADRAGTVIHTTGWNDEKIKVGDTVWSMQKVVEVVSLDRMRGVGTVDEVDSSRVEAGRPFALRVDAHPDTELEGVLANVGDSITRKSRTNPKKVVRVRLEIADNKELPLRPGMRFRGDIEVERIKDTVSVPIAAVFPMPEGPVVYRQSGSGFDRVSVKVGVRSAKEIEILEGLSGGDSVALTIPGAP